MTLALAARLLSVLTLVGCTFEPGTGFATLKSASVSAKLEADAAAANGSLRTDEGYLVTLERFTMYAAELELWAEGDAAHGFDPTNPPPGYGACHGGHCHADDGRLVSYAEIEAETAAGTATTTRIASLQLRGELDCLSGSFLETTRVEPSRELPQTTISSVSLRASRISLRGSVSSGATINPLELAVELPLGERFVRTTDIPVSRDGPATLELVLVMMVPNTLFDGIHFEDLATGDFVDLSERDSTAAQALTRALLESELELQH